MKANQINSLADVAQNQFVTGYKARLNNEPFNVHNPRCWKSGWRDADHATR